MSTAATEHRPLSTVERKRLVNALKDNAEKDLALLMDRRDTSFIGTTDEVGEDEVINAVKSIPCHY